MRTSITPNPKEVMKKSELRVWALRTHSPDQWWVEVDGEVHDSIVSLDEAFRLAGDSENALIIHASHAEEAENPHWMKMGSGDEEDAFNFPNWVCSKCKFAFENPRMPGPSKTEIASYLLIIPGLVLTKRRKNHKNGRCPHCGSKRLIEGRSKAGQVLLKK